MKHRLLNFGLILLLTLSLLGLGSAHAAPPAKSGYWENFDVHIIVNSDGTFWVEERQVLQFSGGTFTFAYRNINQDRLKKITDVQVWGNGEQFTASSNAAAGTFDTYREEGDFYIKWYFAPTEGRQEYLLRYLVHGGLRYYDDGDQLWWKAIPADLIAHVVHSTVTVELPDGATAEVVEAYNINAQSSGQGSPIVTFKTLETIPSGEEFEVRVQFPHGIVAGQAATWQRVEDGKPLIDLAITVLSLLLLVGGLVGLILFWYLRGRDPAVAIPADILPTPPSPDRPGVVGTLVDEKADMEDIIATLVDLARRGYLVFEEEQKKGFFGATNREFTFQRTEKAADGLEKYERQLLNFVFGRGRTRKLSDLKEKFYTHLPTLQKELYQAVVERGYFSASPQQIRGKYSGLGVLLIVLGFLGGIMLSCVGSDYTRVAICPGIALGVVGIATIIVAQFMPEKTEEGKIMALKWEAFRRYLQDLERYTDLTEATALFEQYLPYAIAFGLERAWVKKFTRLPSTTIV
ncbi:MAG TPA: DUF2207 domain-containing protein, partial [Thermoflexia bacterium]|nr:DUF2207 domain-containing protein [Thermoflexia bacterium]